jgi:hypothetical protein
MVAGMSAKKPARTVKRAAVSSTKSAAKKGGAARSPSVRIASADGRRGVEAWLEHVKPEQQRLVRRLDQLIMGAIPEAVCAVKFRKPTNPLGVPFYGQPGRGWIASVNSLKDQVRLIFFAGRALKPMPPLAAPPQARGIDFHSDDEFDEKRLKAWLQQAKRLPGWGRV